MNVSPQCSRFVARSVLRLFVGVVVSVGVVAASVAAELRGEVVGIADGDTVTVLDPHKVQHKVRLAGIDAPEKGQPFGQRSKQALADLVGHRQVVVEWSKTDRYGRKVGTVFVDGTDVCRRQVATGMAWHYKAYESEQSPDQRSAYASAEERARAARRGLWADPDPEPPWDYRKRQRESVQTN